VREVVGAILAGESDKAVARMTVHCELWRRGYAYSGDSVGAGKGTVVGSSAAAVPILNARTSNNANSALIGWSFPSR